MGEERGDRRQKANKNGRAYVRRQPGGLREGEERERRRSSGIRGDVEESEGVGLTYTQKGKKGAYINRGIRLASDAGIRGTPGE